MLSGPGHHHQHGLIRGPQDNNERDPPKVVPKQQASSPVAPATKIVGADTVVGPATTPSDDSMPMPGQKRKSPVASPPQRKARKVELGHDKKRNTEALTKKKRCISTAISTSEENSDNPEPPDTRRLPTRQSEELQDSDSDVAESRGRKSPKTVIKNHGQLPEDEASSSELSVLDESMAPPKRKRKQSSDPPPKTGKSKSAKLSETGKEETVDHQEIKRLQGQLLKCGVRKLWGKELKPYETPKDKIRHLKAMLVDVGMTGRFSAEKASLIKEQRELKADLQEITEREKVWGMDDETNDTGRSRLKKQREAQRQQQQQLFGDGVEESD